MNKIIFYIYHSGIEIDNGELLGFIRLAVYLLWLQKHHESVLAEHIGI